MNGEQAVHRLVRDVVEALGDKGAFLDSSEFDDNCEIKAQLVEWGGGDLFPDEHSQARSSMEQLLARLFRYYGITPVLDAIAELEAELGEMGLELPVYYCSGQPNSKLDQALKIARSNEARWARDREERRQRDR